MLHIRGGGGGGWGDLSSDLYRCYQSELPTIPSAWLGIDYNCSTVKYIKIKLSQVGMRRRWKRRLGGLKRKKRRTMRTVEKEGTEEKEEED